MRRARYVTLAVIALSAAWAAVALYGQELTGRRCNPSFTADCNTAGWMVMYAALFLPVVIALLLSVVAVRVGADWARRRRRP